MSRNPSYTHRTTLPLWEQWHR